MSTQRISISVPTELVRRIKVAAGRRPVSTWITEVIKEPFSARLRTGGGHFQATARLGN